MFFPSEAIVHKKKRENSDIEKELEETQQLKIRLSNLGNRTCDLGKVPFNECEYALKHRIEFDYDTKQQIGETKKDYQERLELIREHSERVVSIKKLLGGCRT